MTNDTRWLARLGIDQGLFTRAQVLLVANTMGPDGDLMALAQGLVDSGVVTDIEMLEKLADLAITKGERSAPASDPFVEDDTAAPFVPATPPPAFRSSLPSAPGAPTSLPAVPGARPTIPFPPAAAPAARVSSDLGAPQPKGPTAPGAAPKFPFENVSAMDDKALATGMRDLLKATARYGASDLHLSTGARPFVRKNRALSFLSDHVLTAQDAMRLNMAVLAEHQKKLFLERKDLDYALALSAADRYRVNLMVHKNGVAGAYRMVPAETRTLEDLGYTPHIATLHKLLSYHNGLILITGPVGSGKTTTLASMVAYLNATRTDHIITVEDPIEVVQVAKGCNVTQREVGPHTRSFASALKGALREDPDVIVIGELRDLETIEMAISASETGHLVIGTMHTSDASTTLNRLLDVFPPAQQTQIRSSVAESLRGVVCQRLVPGAGANAGLVLATEILISNTAIQNLIKEGKTTGLRNTMETGVKEGMCLMDNTIFNLWKEKKITAETAQANITNRVLKAKIV